MKKTLIAAAVISLGGWSVAHALPIAPIPSEGLATPVAQGCGPGFHRDLAGRCVSDERGRPCPPDTRRNAAGRCVSLIRRGAVPSRPARPQALPTELFYDLAIVR